MEISAPMVIDFQVFHILQRNQRLPAACTAHTKYNPMPKYHLQSCIRCRSMFRVPYKWVIRPLLSSFDAVQLHLIHQTGCCCCRNRRRHFKLRNERKKALKKTDVQFIKLVTKLHLHFSYFGHTKIRNFQTSIVTYQNIAWFDVFVYHIFHV